jgi:hypothetical protein
MAAKVSNLFECPKCKSPMSMDSEVKPERCPSPLCRYRFRQDGEPITEKFFWPKDPSEQLFEMKQVLMEKYLDKPLNEINPEVSKELADQMTLGNKDRMAMIEAKLLKERDEFFRTTQKEDVEAWFKSLHYLMSQAVLSGDKEFVMSLAMWGKQIGKMAKGLEKYVKNGGKLNDTKTST